MSWTSLQCFRKIGVSKNFMHNRGYHKFPSKLFLFHSAEKCRRGTLSLISGIEEVWMRGCGGGGGGGCQDFPSKISCLTVPKNFVAQPFRVSLISGIEKIYASEGYVTNFCRNFLSHSAEKFRRATLQDVTNFGYRKNLCFRGLCRYFLSKFLVSQCRKIS